MAIFKYLESAVIPLMKSFFLVPRHYLYLISGIMWSAVGIMLMTMATFWLQDLPTSQPLLIVIVGIIPGLLVAFYGFTHVVAKNIRRIAALEARVSAFAFQAPRSYILVVVMMGMGIYIRHSALIPMMLKTPAYYAMGAALATGSIKNFQEYFKASAISATDRTQQ